MSALLHALVAMSPTQFPASSSEEGASGEELPVTSYPCQWKPPRKRKESNLKMSDIRIQKHVYGKERKVEYLPLEDFDPRPRKFRGSSNEQLKALLGKVRGKGLGVSLLFDSSTQYWTGSSPSSSTPTLPTQSALQYNIDEFKKSLHASDDDLRKIERDTREQRFSPLWFRVRRYRLTASYFGEVFRRKIVTPPDALVVRLLQQQKISSPAIEWGVKHESIAIEQYVKYQHSSGHPDLSVSAVGFHVCPSHPCLGASPDGGVYDPAYPTKPYGLLEIKCPYRYRDMTPLQACSDSSFYCSMSSINSSSSVLKKTHPYYCQIQGQLAICDRPWCDFVVYTPKGLSVERINFDSNFWNNELLPKLLDFYNNCIAPEIVSPVHILGLPLRDLRK